MLPTSRCYIYKYTSPDSVVYVINKKHIKSQNKVLRVPLYSEPYFGRDVRNAVMAWSDRELCEAKINTLKCEQEYNLLVNEISLLDLQGHCNKLGMPLNVVFDVSVVDDVECMEIYFYDNKDIYRQA